MTTEQLHKLLDANLCSTGAICMLLLPIIDLLYFIFKKLDEKE